MTEPKYSYLEYRWLRVLGKTKPVKTRCFNVLTSKLLLELYFEERSKWKRAGISSQSPLTDIYRYYIKEYKRYVKNEDKICRIRYTYGTKILHQIQNEKN